ncbi:MAG: transposase [Desulfomonile tiedjei]|nr:transposase [Desulfomonile tiedjei]
MREETPPPNRRTIRLKGYDYSRPGAYFVTICTVHKQSIFGRVASGDMMLNALGHMVRKTWKQIPVHCSGTSLDEFVVMPNHLHGIIILEGAHVLSGADSLTRAASLQEDGQARGPAPTATLPGVIHHFKSFTTRLYVEHDAPPIWGISGRRLWHRNYFEHIIRNGASLNRIREYIASNPSRWELDRENPMKRGTDDFDQWLLRHQ